MRDITDIRETDGVDQPWRQLVYDRADLIAAVDERDKEIARLRAFAVRVAAGDVRHAVVEARRALGQPLIDEAS